MSLQHSPHNGQVYQLRTSNFLVLSANAMQVCCTVFMYLFISLQCSAQYILYPSNYIKLSHARLQHATTLKSFIWFIDKYVLAITVNNTIVTIIIIIMYHQQVLYIHTHTHTYISH